MSGATPSFLLQDIVAGIRSVVGPWPVALHEPMFTGQEWRYVKECLDSTFVSSVGRFVDRFEAELAVITRAALHLSMVLVVVERDDEVLTPALSCAATANVIRHAGAMPHFDDSEERTLDVDPLALCEDLDSMRKRRSSDGELLTRNARYPVWESNANCSDTYLRRE
jgi:hypothetical protein